MAVESIPLPSDPAAALGVLREVSRRIPTMVFKRSPRCPISFAAEAEWRAFLASDEAALAAAEIDVIAERPLARGLTELLGIRHESPQALLLRDGAVAWHDSHERLTATAFARELSTPRLRP